MILLLFFVLGTAGFSSWFIQLKFDTPFIPPFLLILSGLIASILAALIVLYILSYLQYWGENLTRKRLSR
ncbi:MAG: hypothetical protein Q7S86_00155 [bacterium]|nr:hypothetical protein [bacterium]